MSWNRKYESTLGPAVEIGALQPKPMHDLLLREVLRSIPPLHVFNGHCTHSNALADLLLQEEIQTIALVRDPRDVVVSLAEYLIKHEHPQYRGKSWNKCLRQAIEGYSPIHAPRVRPTEERGWQQAWQAFLPWKEVKGVLFLRFEDLVGPEGGGSEETQLQNIRRILDFAGKQTLPAEEIHGNVFGAHAPHPIRTSAGAVLAAGKRNSLLKTNPDLRMSSATYLSGWATKPTPTGEISD